MRHYLSIASYSRECDGSVKLVTCFCLEKRSILVRASASNVSHILFCPSERRDWHASSRPHTHTAASKHQPCFIQASHTGDCLHTSAMLYLGLTPKRLSPHLSLASSNSHTPVATSTPQPWAVAVSTPQPCFIQASYTSSVSTPQPCVIQASHPSGYLHT